MSFGEVPLEDLVEGRSISYGIVQPGTDGDSGVPIVRVGDLESGSLSTAKPKMRVDPTIEARFRKTRLCGGEVLVSLVGTAGRAAVVPTALAGWNVARAVGVLRPAGVEPEWLAYALGSPLCQNQISAALNTTVQATLNLSDLKKVRIPMPDSQSRRAIAEVLGALDDKIAANHSIDALVMDLLTSEFDQIQRHAADERTLGQLVELRYGKALPATDRRAGQVDVYGSGGVTGSHDEALCRAPGIVVGRKGTVGAVYWAATDYYPIDTVFYVVPRAGIDLEYVYFLMKSLPLSELNSDSAVPGLNRDEAYSQRVRVAGQRAVEQFSDRVRLLFARKSAASIESGRLATLRDTLLPHLMSGRITVREAEKAVEGVF